MVAGSRQLKIGLRVEDLDRSLALYRRIGFREIPSDPASMVRYLTFRHTWLILASRHSHGYHHPERELLARTGPMGSGVVVVVPTTDIAGMRDLWRAEGLPVTLEVEDVGSARVFYGLDPDGYEVMFEQFPT
ncbi:VOC family protein [Nocardioides sp. zg-DK7169]|uniref:VOC family protein n=1 Tax=Nocardioides sp. zg-DK7169 TaxID=2736600 RepID=UPI001557AC19|nr:VOC family protein [Nocardioides sp. zg-DK7169]NPC96184.1 VOC family protein [Nocardioides sp. zg-DK7169]